MGLNLILYFVFLAIVVALDTVVLRAFGLTFQFRPRQSPVNPSPLSVVILTALVFFPAMLTLAVCVSPSSPDVQRVVVGALATSFFWPMRHFVFYKKLGKEWSPWKT